MTNIFDIKGRREDQYRAALAKPAEKRGAVARAVIQQGERRHAGDAPAADATQIIRVYSGKHMDRNYMVEANKLLAQGWHIEHQSYSGTSGPGLGKVLLIGVFAFAGKRGAKSLTVVYSK
jgi:hypothetical protein